MSRSARPGTTTAPTAGYLGWHGRGNVGDDAIHDAVRGALRGVELVDVPLYRRDVVRGPGRVVQLRRRAAGLVLGGGTCVGRSNWRRHVQWGRWLVADGAAFAVGVGVEDPAFSGRHSFSGQDELAQWAAVLRCFTGVSVRGPRSAELLGDVGVEATVVGDPALVLASPRAAPISGRIGINLGFGDDLWGHDPSGTAAAVGAACTILSGRGYELRGILLNADDRSWTEAALHDTGGVPMEIVPVPDAATAVSELAACEVALVSRLHAGVLAAVAGTPTVGLEYQPKCRDFALSVGAADLLVRTDAVVAADLVELVEHAHATRAVRAVALRGAVDLLRGRLQLAYADVLTELGVLVPAPTS
jgi:hypothetical protein